MFIAPLHSPPAINNIHLEPTRNQASNQSPPRTNIIHVESTRNQRHPSRVHQESTAPIQSPTGMNIIQKAPKTPKRLLQFVWVPKKHPKSFKTPIKNPKWKKKTLFGTARRPVNDLGDGHLLRAWLKDGGSYRPRDEGMDGAPLENCCTPMFPFSSDPRCRSSRGHAAGDEEPAFDCELNDPHALQKAETSRRSITCINEKFHMYEPGPCGRTASSLCSGDDSSGIVSDEALTVSVTVSEEALTMSVPGLALESPSGRQAVLSHCARFGPRPGRSSLPSPSATPTEAAPNSPRLRYSLPVPGPPGDLGDATARQVRLAGLPPPLKAPKVASRRSTGSALTSHCSQPPNSRGTESPIKREDSVPSGTADGSRNAGVTKRGDPARLATVESLRVLGCLDEYPDRSDSAESVVLGEATDGDLVPPPPAHTPAPPPTGANPLGRAAAVPSSPGRSTRSAGAKGVGRPSPVAVPCTQRPPPAAVPRKRHGAPQDLGAGSGSGNELGPVSSLVALNLSTFLPFGNIPGPGSGVRPQVRDARYMVRSPELPEAIGRPLQPAPRSQARPPKAVPRPDSAQLHQGTFVRTPPAPSDPAARTETRRAPADPAAPSPSPPMPVQGRGAYLPFVPAVGNRTAQKPAHRNRTSRSLFFADSIG